MGRRHVSTILKNIDIDMVIFENSDIGIDKAILKNINIDIDRKSLRNIDIDKGIIKWVQILIIFACFQPILVFFP